MSVTKVPGIPAPTQDNLQDVARAIKGILEVREGLLGDPLDRAVTLRDLVDGGLAQTYVTGSGRSPLGLAPVPDIPVDSGAPMYDPTADMTPPPGPTNLRSTGAFAGILLQWDMPVILNLAYTEVWRSPVNVIGNAVMIGTSTSSMYSDYVGANAAFYYWVRFVTRANITGPYNGTNGTYGATAQDPAILLETLTGQITESQLYKTLGARISLIDGPSTQSGSVNARVKVVQDIASVKNRTFYSAAEPLNTTSAPLTLGDLWFKTDDNNKPRRWDGTAWQLVTDTRVGQLVTDLSTETTSRINGDLAETRRRDALYAASFAGTGNSYKIFVQETQPVGTQIGDIWSWVNTLTGEVIFSRFNGTVWADSSGNKRAAVYMGAFSNPPASSIVIGDLYFDIEDKKVYVFNGSAWVPKVTTMPDVAAFVYSEQVARVDGDGALAQTISTVSATKTRSYWQTSAPTGTTQIPLVEGDLWFDTDDNNRVYRWSGSQWQSGRDGAIAIVDARVSNVETAKIGYCKINNLATDHTDKVTCEAAGGTWVVGLPLATAVKQVSVTDGTTTATLEQRFTAQKDLNNALKLQYTVKLDNAGRVSGFGLYNSTGEGTDFAVRSDRFSIAAPVQYTGSAVGLPAPANRWNGYVWLDTSVTPSVTRYWLTETQVWTTTSPLAPFSVQVSPATINGKLVPAGVYITDAFIKNASITAAKIGSVDADTITTTGLLTSPHAQTGIFWGSELYLGGSMSYVYESASNPNSRRLRFNGAPTNPSIALRGGANPVAEFTVDSFRIKNDASTTGVKVFEVASNVVKITSAAIGTITANQIDTRGLDIKDTAGNVVFSSGTKLKPQYLSGVVPGSNLLMNTRFGVKASATDRRPLGYNVYNSSNIAFQWVDPASGYNGTTAFGLKALAQTSARFGLFTDSSIVEKGITGGVFGGWRPNRSYLVSFRARLKSSPVAVASLAQAVSLTATQIFLTTGVGLPTTFPYFLTIQNSSDPAIFEVVEVSTASATQLTVLRGKEGTSARAWSISQPVFVRPLQVALGWNVTPSAAVIFSNPLLTNEYQLYAVSITWGNFVEAGGALYISTTGTVLNGVELHIDQLMVADGDTLTDWSPSERDSASLYNPLSYDNITTWIEGASIDTALIRDAAIKAAKIDNLAVTEAKIANGAITTAKIGSAQIDTLRLAGEAVFVPRFVEMVAQGIDLSTDYFSGDIASLSIPITGLADGETVRVIVILLMQVYPGNSVITDMLYGIFAKDGANAAAQNNETAATIGANGISVAAVGSFLTGNGNKTVSVRVKASGASKANNTFSTRLVVMAGKR